jgi:hypothetical protein
LVLLAVGFELLIDALVELADVTFELFETVVAWRVSLTTKRTLPLIRDRRTKPYRERRARASASRARPQTPAPHAATIKGRRHPGGHC